MILTYEILFSAKARISIRDAEKLTAEERVATAIQSLQNHLAVSNNPNRRITVDYVTFATVVLPAAHNNNVVKSDLSTEALQQ